MYGKVSSVKSTTRSLTWLHWLFGESSTVKPSYNCYSFRYAKVITNCRNLATQSIPKNDLLPIVSKQLKCLFCGLDISVEANVTETLAIVCHIIEDHVTISSDSAVLSFLLTSDTGIIFPFIDNFYEGIVESDKANRRLRCAKCHCIFENVTKLKVHARLHLDEKFTLDPLEYTVMMSTQTLLPLLYSVDGLGPNFNQIQLPPPDAKNYACLGCEHIFEDSPMLGFQIYEHVRTWYVLLVYLGNSCMCFSKLPSTDVVPECRSAKPISINNNFVHRYSFYECGSCHKGYQTQISANSCCIMGGMMPVIPEILSKKVKRVNFFGELSHG